MAQPCSLIFFYFFFFFLYIFSRLPVYRDNVSPRRSWPFLRAEQSRAARDLSLVESYCTKWRNDRSILSGSGKKEKEEKMEHATIRSVAPRVQRSVIYGDGCIGVAGFTRFPRIVRERTKVRFRVREPRRLCMRNVHRCTYDLRKRNTSWRNHRVFTTPVLSRAGTTVFSITERRIVMHA